MNWPSRTYTATNKTLGGIFHKRCGVLWKKSATFLAYILLLKANEICDDDDNDGDDDDDVVVVVVDYDVDNEDHDDD